MSWVDDFGINHPVVADPGFGVTSRFVDGGSIGLPSMDLLAPGGEVLIRDSPVDETDIKNNLP